ncbi:hypothetical protein [Ferruginibacter albus]|uniref:hypothetical protein n=1 Tax=Ferruginibacter albus TaxID=2875540 RepID=UPI001CC51D29|nr:hypothetical protein [Ferruginibacter albus]UAY52112.1 hypothetical protein K9M53_00110 [Ferruginibacter albus]
MEELSRLSQFGDLQKFAKQYIYTGLTDEELLDILVKTKKTIDLPVFNEELLKNDAVQLQTAKILGILQCCSTKADFEELAKKLIEKQNSYRTPVNFAQIMQRMVKLTTPNT